jgi:hypothetical protein
MKIYLSPIIQAHTKFGKKIEILKTEEFFSKNILENEKLHINLLA